MKLTSVFSCALVCSAFFLSGCNDSDSGSGYVPDAKASVLAGPWEKECTSSKDLGVELDNGLTAYGKGTMNVVESGTENQGTATLNISPYIDSNCVFPLIGLSAIVIKVEYETGDDVIADANTVSETTATEIDVKITSNSIAPNTVGQKGYGLFTVKGSVLQFGPASVSESTRPTTMQGSSMFLDLGRFTRP
ncbi:MAG: hypothetical protein AAGF06_07165 [Pseudomonadota bacterium]